MKNTSGKHNRNTPQENIYENIYDKNIGKTHREKTQ